MDHTAGKEIVESHSGLHAIAAFGGNCQDQITEGHGLTTVNRFKGLVHFWKW
jgi:hypothetical protein